jgi:hypothetical protein
MNKEIKADEQWSSKSTETKVGIVPGFYARPKGQEENPIKLDLSPEVKAQITELYSERYIKPLELFLEHKDRTKDRRIREKLIKHIAEDIDIDLYTFLEVIQNFENR